MKAFLTESIFDLFEFDNRIKYILNKLEMYPITPWIYFTSATCARQVRQDKFDYTPLRKNTSIHSELKLEGKIFLRISSRKIQNSSCSLFIYKVNELDLLVLHKNKLQVKNMISIELS